MLYGKFSGESLQGGDANLEVYDLKLEQYIKRLYVRLFLPHFSAEPPDGYMRQHEEVPFIPNNVVIRLYEGR